MEILFEKISNLKSQAGVSKHDSIVRGIQDAIEEGQLVLGNALPSVNKMVSETGFARKTIVKAYSDLREKGIIESKNRLGYFIASEDTSQVMQVALVLYAFHTFQEIFYNTFRSHLGQHIKIDVYFHHNNIVMFENIIASITSKYKMYVVAPIQHQQTREIMGLIPTDKLLMVDRYCDLGKPFSHITQEFETSLYQALVKLEATIQTYDKMVLYFQDESDYPLEVLKAFRRFCQHYKVEGEIYTRYQPEHLQKGMVYFTIGDNDLWGILKDVKAKNWVIGKDIGIISHNDTPVKEIISGGITTFSTDFELMAQKAATYVLNKQGIQETIPSILIRRNSL